MSELPSSPSLEQLQKRAKERLRSGADATLADAQFAIAREHGFETWAQLKHNIEIHRLAADLAAAYGSGDEALVRGLNANFGTAFPTDFHDPEKFRQAVPTVAHARRLVARAYGSRSPFYSIDWEENRLAASGPQSRKDWEEIFAVIAEHGIAKFEASGIPDEAMGGLARLECVTHLNVAGSKALTDEGARMLARMPQLVDLEIGGWYTSLTDRALEALRHLPRLRHLKACWTPGLTDRSAEHISSDVLETVNVMGTPSGDSWIRALAGKPALRFFDTGRCVTDEGIPELHQIPAFKKWLGGDVRVGLMGGCQPPNRLAIDGDFTDAGLAGLEGLEGVAALSFFGHSKSFTAGGLEPLRLLPRLEIFGIDGDQCDDEALRQIAAIPRLRQLQAQGAVAGDAGWLALGRSRTLEYLWGRDCPNFSSRAFAAMGNLRGLGISCKRVEDLALAALPSFPNLGQFVSIDVPDEGFRHIGRCQNLDSLFCMYCRDTGDAATAHIADLPTLRTYYAGMTQITDRSLEILSRMESLEDLEFWQCEHITNAGIALVAALPRLRRLEVQGSK